ncbi:MAG: hypothetical protein II574_10885, partial [Ruminococcus sp.]|nr:hypothetical protein [Ruminococcus sp.]
RHPRNCPQDSYPHFRNLLLKIRDMGAIPISLILSKRTERHKENLSKRIPLTKPTDNKSA